MGVKYYNYKVPNKVSLEYFSFSESFRESFLRELLLKEIEKAVEQGFDGVDVRGLAHFVGVPYRDLRRIAKELADEGLISVGNHGRFAYPRRTGDLEALRKAIESILHFSEMRRRYYEEYGDEGW